MSIQNRMNALLGEGMDATPADVKQAIKRLKVMEQRLHACIEDMSFVWKNSPPYMYGAVNPSDTMDLLQDLVRERPIKWGIRTSVTALKLAYENALKEMESGEA